MATRDWLVRNIKGIGYKEASHFLRNIGFGGRLAILDVHILRNLVKFGVLREIPKSLSRGKYIELERKAGRFADKAGIPMDHLDLLFWSEQTGMIFK
jgi:N-glycosylase/DNA lyase